MSNRDSLGFGDLIPQDVVDIFAQEKHSKRGQKKRSHSLGRALGWLKGKKRKDLGAKGQGLGLGPALDLALDGHPAGHQGGHKGGQRGRQTHPQGHAVPKRDDDDKTQSPQLFQENVFIEVSRPKYLENLHSEALEGLKMMQQEETNNGVEYQDNESTVSTMTVHTDGEGGGFVTDSTIADTTSVISVQSSVSTRSSRSGLTRQESTFRPLNSGKKSEKAKRRRHKKTAEGIPKHVQRELGLDRAGWTLTQRLDEEQLHNGETDSDGPQQAAESQKGAGANAIHPLNKDQLKQLTATHAAHRDDLALLHCLGSDLSGEQRAQSLAVPWMTTANSLQQEPPSPVMSMSPQAAYMSKIIPNAVLPPSIEVVEISRGRSRNSVRTVSKSSLLLSSPAPSRASSRASTITSASRHNAPNPSDSSCWSNSESSETLVSDSSTISSSSTPRQKKSQDRDDSAKEDKISIHSSISKASKCTSNGKLVIKGDEVKKEGPFVRSLSVMKPKRAPPPPNRSYSLHNKMKRRSRDLAEVFSGESSLHTISAAGEENDKNKSGSSPVPSRTIDSPGYNADTSSLDDSAGSASFSPLRFQLQALKAEEAAKVEETASKHASQEKQDPLPENKLSKTLSPSSGYSSHDGTSTHVSKQTHSSSPRHKRGIFAKLQKFFPGSTPAASTPPPPTQPEALENTEHTEDPASVSPSVRALRELFNIPPPPKVHAPPPPPPEVWAHSKRTFELLLGPPAPDNIQAIIKKNPKDRRQQRKSPSASAEGSVKSLVVERKHKYPAPAVESMNGSLHTVETKKVQESEILNAENSDRLAEQNVDLKENRKVTVKDEKVRVSDILNGMLVKAVVRREERLSVVRQEESKKINVDTLPAISLVHNPPSTQTPTKQTTEVASAATIQVVSPESFWPPPPPPMGLSVPDEIDFPLPPPPMFGEEALVIPVQVPPERSSPGGVSFATTKTECVRVITEAEPQQPSTSQGIAPPPLNIPPPPPYTAPPPPVEAVNHPTIKKVSHPLPKEVSPPLPTKEISLPPPIEVSPPPPKEVSPLPPTPKEVHSPPPKEISPPPPPPPPKEVSPPPFEEVSPAPPPPKEVSPLAPPPPPPKEVSPSPPTEVSPLPPKSVSLVRPKEFSPPLAQIAPPPPVKDVSSTLVVVVSSSPVKEVSPSLVIGVSPLPPQEVSILSTEEVPPSLQENAHQSSEEATSVSKLTPPQSIPPPPPLLSQSQLSEQEIDLPEENIPSESESILVSSNSILTPPQSIPPLPPIQVLHQPEVVPPNTDGPTTPEASNSPPSEASVPSALENSPSTEKALEPALSPPVNIPLPPPLPVQGLANIKHQPSPASIENQTPEPTSAPVVQEEPTPIVTPSILQMVKLRSVSSSPEPPKAQEEPEVEVTMRSQQPSSHVPTSSSSGEAPQKPIRRSMIMISPPPTSPPAVITSQPALPKSQPLVVPPASSATVLSPTKKSPPAVTVSPSMNLQEAIRLRTAARSKSSPASRLSLHSPTSPIDLHKSPSSTASFIFSKSNKKAVIETKPAPETKAIIQNNLEVSSETKVVSEAELVKREIKVPPPVAKKPKTKGKEIETSEGKEQTAGQEVLQENIKDAAEKTNGTAGTVEGGGTPSDMIVKTEGDLGRTY
ncbi:NHS-like protein 3 [Chaetodon trifascialis]|uniref:NHS-like protein 3 n=1 Tax=Chaetodon trifascialis TaxID=109706 RepID=UPI003991B6A0